MADGEMADLVMREWAKGHERVCEERMATLRGDVGEVKDSIKTMNRAATGVIIALLGWLAIQVYDRVQAPAYSPLAHLEQRR